jgi:hypothetical protein
LSKKWIFVALSGLLVIPLFVGCDAVAPEVKTLQTQMAAIIEWKAQAQADINTAKSTAGGLSGQVNNAVNDVNSLRSQINNLPANNSYTKAEIDAKITAAVAAATADYTAKIAAIGSGSGSGSGGSSSGSGTVGSGAKLLSSDQDLELWLEWVDPNKDLNAFATRFTNEVEFSLSVKNKSVDSTRKFDIEMRLTPEEDTVVTLPPTYLSTTMGTWTVSRSPNTLRNAMIFTSPSTSGRISRNSTDKYNLRLQMVTTPSVYWKVRFYITQIDD